LRSRPDDSGDDAGNSARHHRHFLRPDRAPGRL